MLIIDASSGMKTLDQVVNENARILAREIVETICEAIDEDAPQILIAIIRIPNDDVPYELELKSTYSFYEHNLRNSILTLVRTEEYELCAKALEYADQLAMRSESSYAL